MQKQVLEDTIKEINERCTAHKKGGALKKGTEITTHSKAWYEMVNICESLAACIVSQIDYANIMLAKHGSNLAKNNALLEHRKRDAAKFLTERMSARLQLCLSPFDNIDVPLLVSDGTRVSEIKAIQTIIIDPTRLPDGLLRAFFERIEKDNQQPVHRWLKSYLHNNELRQRYITIHANQYLPFIKEFLGLSIPLDYMENGNVKTSPRVSKLGEGYLLLQHNDIVYTEKHLKKYTGRNFFLLYFRDKSHYLHHEQETIIHLLDQKKRFLTWDNAIHINFQTFLDTYTLSREQHTHEFGTNTDRSIQAIISQWEKGGNWKNQYEENIKKHISERLGAIDAMINTIHAQIGGI